MVKSSDCVDFVGPQEIIAWITPSKMDGKLKQKRTNELDGARWPSRTQTLNGCRAPSFGDEIKRGKWEKGEKRNKSLVRLCWDKTKEINQCRRSNHKKAGTESEWKKSYLIPVGCQIFNDTCTTRFHWCCRLRNRRRRRCSGNAQTSASGRVVYALWYFSDEQTK